MTTIAFRGGVMASDSSVSTDDVWEWSDSKLFVGRDGSVLGFAGDFTVHPLVLEWAWGGYKERDARRIRESGGDFEALHALPDGRLMFYSSSLSPIQVKSDYAAIGSGSKIALGALCHGATAVEAVECACQHDLYSRAPVSSVAVVERSSGRRSKLTAS